MKLLKYDLCNKCRLIKPIMNDGKPYENTIESFLDSPGNNTGMGFVMINQMLLLDLQNSGGCQACINLFKKVTQSEIETVMPEIIESVRKKAESGDAEAMFNLAMKLFFASGINNENYETEANHWIEKAAKLDYADAQFELACIYKDEKNDEATGLRWLKKSAENGHTKAKHNLAVHYYSLGEYKQAINWMEQASNEDHAGATFKLAYYYQKGIGVPADTDKSMMLIEKAAELGNEEAKNIIKNIYS
jgi:hypothetical protein